MIQRELMKDSKLKHEDWTRFLPKFDNKNPNKKVKKPKSKEKKKKEYTPFPPQQTESKIDKQLASGEYFLTEMEKRAKISKDRRQKQEKDKKTQQDKRDKDFVPPTEEPRQKKSKVAEEINIKALKSKIKKAVKTKN